VRAAEGFGVCEASAVRLIYGKEAALGTAAVDCGGDFIAALGRIRAWVEDGS